MATTILNVDGGRTQETLTVGPTNMPLQKREGLAKCMNIPRQDAYAVNSMGGGGLFFGGTDALYLSVLLYTHMPVRNPSLVCP